mmetsp:Transcript_38142/g.61506  ORF Transcript_38142/g.61506 Transcript_38142/m.61506 type:complete len:282 (-) Transcript_38142:516-1361(-)
MMLSTQPQMKLAQPQMKLDFAKPAVAEGQMLATKTVAEFLDSVSGGDVETTDAGSSESEESGWSSSSEFAKAEQNQKQQPRSSRRLQRPTGEKRVRIIAGRCFRGTPLSPIPGTPVAAGGDFSGDAFGFQHVMDGASYCSEGFALPPPPPPSPATPSSSGVLQLPGMPSPPGLSLLQGPTPNGCKEQARRAVLDRAKAEGLPLKVRIPEAASSSFRALDSALPAKKRVPYWPELAASWAAAASLAVQNLDPQKPAMKRPSSFLLEAPCFLPQKALFQVLKL